MFGSQKSLPGAIASIDPIGNIISAVRTLISPSSSLYYACNRERIEKQAEHLATLDVELENIRKQAFAAGARLMALQQQALGEGGAV